MLTVDVLSPWSLLLLARRPGGGGARPPGAFGIPGIGGAPSADGAGPPDDPALTTTGAERSFVVAFLSALPLWISARSAPCECVSEVLAWPWERFNGPELAGGRHHLMAAEEEEEGEAVHRIRGAAAAAVVVEEAASREMRSRSLSRTCLCLSFGVSWP